ncbi:hypothetical protein H0H93_006870 [Arthromyces matolae]|nr:hypothetical protein H0H93_006870 [Arthromyces matolae]
MKTIISQCFAMSFIGASFLACASPIALNPNTLVRRDSLASVNSISNNVRGISSFLELAALNVELSNSNGLTRRDGRASPVPSTINPPTHTDPTIYDTPLAFWNFLQDRYSIVLHQRIIGWDSIVQELEAKVDSLQSFEFPGWLVEECWEEIDSAGPRIQWFLSKEHENTPRYTFIKKHEADIDRVKRKLSELAPKQGVRVPSPTPDVKENESSVVGQEPDNQIHGVHGRPLHSHSPSSATRSEDIRHQQLMSVNELHLEARRTRIQQWDRDQVGPLEVQLQRLSESGFLYWLVDDFDRQITHQQHLVALFAQEERRYSKALETERYYDPPSLDILKRRRAALFKVLNSLKDMRAEFRESHLRHVLPKMRDGGDWRQVVNHFADEVKKHPSHPYDGKEKDNQIAAGFEVYDAMALATSLQDNRTRQLFDWRNFLDQKEKEIEKAKQEFHAGQRGRSPTVTDRR